MPRSGEPCREPSTCAPAAPRVPHRESALAHASATRAPLREGPAPGRQSPHAPPPRRPHMPLPASVAAPPGARVAIARQRPHRDIHTSVAPSRTGSQVRERRLEVLGSAHGRLDKGQRFVSSRAFSRSVSALQRAAEQDRESMDGGPGRVFDVGSAAGGRSPAATRLSRADCRWFSGPGASVPGLGG